MANIQILNGGVQPLSRVWRLTVATADETSGVLAAGEVLTVAIWDPTSELWWSALGPGWGALREEIPMTDDTVDGLHTLDLDPAALNVGESDLVFVVTSVTKAATGVLSWRYDMQGMPVTVDVVPGTPATFGQLAGMLAAWFGNDVKVDDQSKRLIVYLADGVTPALQFDLKDATGLPSAMEPFQRLRV